MLVSTILRTRTGGEGGAVRRQDSTSQHAVGAISRRNVETYIDQAFHSTTTVKKKDKERYRRLRPSAYRCPAYLLVHAPTRAANMSSSTSHPNVRLRGPPPGPPTATPSRMVWKTLSAAPRFLASPKPRMSTL